PIVSWGAPPGGEVPPRLPEHQGQHQNVLSRVLRWRALREHQLGNDREAAELILDLLQQQRVLEHGPPTLIVHVLALVVRSRAAECVLEIASTLDVSDSPQSSSPGSPVTRHQASQIIHDLLDDTDSHHAGRRACYAMRMVDLHAAE